MFEFIEPIVSALPAVRTDGVTDWLQGQALDVQDTTKIVFGALLTVAAAVGLFIAKGKIGKIVVLILALVIGGWLVLNDGWSWGRDKFEDQVNSAPASLLAPVDRAEL